MTQANRHNPDRPAILHLRIPGWLKNELIDAAETAGLSLTAYITTTLYRTLHEPPAGLEPVRPIPTAADTLRAYLTGDTIIAPCGQRYPCAGSETEPLEVAGFRYCVNCSVRVG